MEPAASDWRAVMSRLETLESQNRRMKQIGLVGVMLVGAILLMGQASSNRKVEANEFVLIDSSARIRATLSMNLGGPVLQFLQESGKPVLTLFARGDAEQLSFGDPDRIGPPALHLGISTPERADTLNPAGPFVHLWNGRASVRLDAESGSRGGSVLPSVEISKDEKVIWKAP